MIHFQNFHLFFSLLLLCLLFVEVTFWHGGGGFFHSKGTWGCAAREGILFRPFKYSFSDSRSLTVSLISSSIPLSLLFSEPRSLICDSNSSVTLSPLGCSATSDSPSLSLSVMNLFWSASFCLQCGGVNVQFLAFDAGLSFLFVTILNFRTIIGIFTARKVRIST